MSVRVPLRSKYSLVCLIPFLAFGMGGRVAGNGLDAPQPVAPFLNGVFPVTAPGETTGWATENAFPNLTFIDPLWLKEIPGTNEFLVVGKNGQIWRFANDPAVTQIQVTKVLEWVSNTQSSADQGFYSLVFHPEFGQAGSPNADYVYVCYNHKPALAGADANHSFWRVSRFTWLPATGTLDPGSEFVFISQYDRCRWHNGGAMFFDNTGFLNVTCGDGGDSAEGGGLTGADGSLSRTQRLDFGLFSGIFRIDVDNDPAKSHAIRRQPQSPTNKPAGWPASFTQGYGIPNDNPWQDVDGGILEEYRSLGLRSPHTAHYDITTGEVWVGDVGEGAREEMTNLQMGGNAQWGYREGDIAGPGTTPASIIGTDTPPTYAYPRNVGSCIIGGMRYRGTKWNSLLDGKLIFGDHARGRIWTASLTTGEAPVTTEIIQGFPSGSKAGIANFFTDSTGEIYIMRVNGTNQPGGTIHKLSSAGVSSEPPLLLSQTGVFTDLATLAIAPGAVPYDIESPLWSDAAAKFRWLFLPNDGSHDTAAEKIIFSEKGNWTFPAGTDAELLTTGEEELFNVILQDGSSEPRQWDFPSRADCMLCHNTVAGQALGVQTASLNTSYHYTTTGRTANQLVTYNSLGMFDRTLSATELENFIEARALGDDTAPIEHRVRSYLDSNCSHCHQADGVIPYFNARLGTPLHKQGMIDGILQGHFSLGPDGRYIKPGDPDYSAIFVRMNNVHNGAAMPPLAKNLIDEHSIEVLQTYINGLTPAEFATTASPQARFIRLTATSEVNGNPWTSVGEFSPLDGSGLPIPFSELAVFDFDSEEIVDANNPAANAIDGDANTFWHTGYGTGGIAPLPHHLTVDLGSLRELGGFIYTPRQGAVNGRIKDYQVHSSTDGVVWTLMDSGTWPNSDVNQTYNGLAGQRAARCNIAGPAGQVSGAFDITIAFDMDVTDFTATDLQVAGGDVIRLRGKGYYYVATIAPTAPSITVNVPQNAADPLGLGSLASTTLSLSFLDIQPPSPRFVNVPTGVSAPFQLRLTFDEVVTGLDSGDFSILNATLDAITPDGIDYLLTLSPSGATSITVQLLAGAVTDTASNLMGSGISISIPYSAVVLAREAEDSTITGGFVIVQDPSASGGSYIWVPQNSRPDFSLDPGLKVSYAFVLPRPGSYYVRGLVRSDDASSDSFHIGVDGQSDPVPWHTNQISGQTGSLQFHWDTANSSRDPVNNPLVFNFATPGPHTVELYGRDDGTRIDRLELRPLLPLPVWSAPGIAVNGPFTATLDFTEDVTGLEVSDFVVDGGLVTGLNGSGSNYQVTIQPTAGTVVLSVPENVVISATGGGNYASDIASVLARSAYQHWAILHGTDESPASMLGDDDHDGIAKLLEFAFNLDPGVSDHRTYPPEGATATGGLPRLIVAEEGGGARLQLQYLRRKDIIGLSYIPEFGETLNDFAETGGPPVIEDLNTEWQRVTVPDTSPVGSPRRFGRVRVIQE